MNRIYRTATLVLVSLCCMSSSSACNPGHEEWNPDTPPHEQPGGDEGKDELYPKEDGVIRLVTYNVGVFSKYMDDSTAMIADMMNELGADALAVNELDWYNDRHNTDQLKNLASALGEWDYMYGKAIEYRNGYYGEGAAVKSSLGVKDKYEVPLPQGVGAEARVLVVIETEKFVFASTHLDHVSDEARTEQAGLISSALKEKYGDPRRTEIVPSADEFNPEDFYADEDVVITISHSGYIKRTPLAEYRLQNRGGVGSKGSTTKDEDFIEHIYVANTHSTMLFFTDKGKCYWLKVYEIPEGTKTSKGRAIQNVINIEPDDHVCAYLNVGNLNDEEYINSHYIVLATKRGTIKKTLLEAYSRPRQKGVNAITIKEGDGLLEAVLTDGDNDILLAARKGKCVRFHESQARSIGRTAAGVRGISIEDDDEVIGMVCARNVKEGETALGDILVVSENGFGKRSPLEDYRITSRGAKGVKTINITDKTGELIAVKMVSDDNDLMIINKSGITIRVPASDIRVAGRATQGVKLINLREGDTIAAVCVVNKSEEKVQENGEEL